MDLQYHEALPSWFLSMLSSAPLMDGIKVTRADMERMYNADDELLSNMWQGAVSSLDSIRHYGSYNLPALAGQTWIKLLIEAIWKHRAIGWGGNYPQGGATALQRGIAAQIREQYYVPSQKDFNYLNRIVHSKNSLVSPGIALNSIEDAAKAYHLQDYKQDWKGGAFSQRSPRSLRRSLGTA